MGIYLVSKKVTAWLEELGLGQYAIAFEENELDLDQLIDLSNGDLKDLGVTIMGHRKKLFRAIDTHSGLSRYSICLPSFVMGLVWIKIPGDTDLLDACNRAYESILREITNIAYISILHVIHQ
jgi:hypothetical protein